jgi:hypothetical protein
MLLIKGTSPEAFDRQSGYIVSGCRYLLHFHFVPGAHEQYIHVFLLLPKCIGNGYSREYMAPGPSTSDKYVSPPAHDRCFNFGFQGIGLFLDPIAHTQDYSKGNARKDK